MRALGIVDKTVHWNPVLYFRVCALYEFIYLFLNDISYPLRIYLCLLECTITMKQITLEELIDISANNEIKNSINVAVNKLPVLLVERLSRKMCQNKRIVVTPYYLQMFYNGVEELTLDRPDCSEKILIRTLMWLDNVESFSSLKAYDWLVKYEFSNDQIGWITPHIMDYIED